MVVPDRHPLTNDDGDSIVPFGCALYLCSGSDFEALTTLWRNPLYQIPHGPQMSFIPVDRTIEYLAVMPGRSRLQDVFRWAQENKMDYLVIQEKSTG